MDVVKVRKQNRILDVPASRLEAFLQQGYDQIDEQGNVVRRATGGRYVSVAEYNQLADELEKAKAELAKLKKK
ncbi:hypothetical protein [Geobacillus stearothermophilus]|uniref:hypothetical protein n=1 Tax=Geobacillus stearothermophilus TaxID=1422 RepID=UPI002402A51E|nr:hypothetical protein [Geobacillus stearothermophilus]MDF9296102.1 hypothetical protein [Geobacillus stearothermophilus]